MYLRTIARRNQDGSLVRYYQLAHNVRNARGQSQAQVLYSFGREEELDKEALARLVRSISRVLGPEQALAAGAPEDLHFLSSRSLGGGLLLDHLWRRLGIDAAIRRALARRRYPADIERAIFALVANRALAPSSKLRCAQRWAREQVALPGVDAFSEDDAYRAMDALLQCEGELALEVYSAVATLLSLEVDLIFFDTTSTYFETEDEDPSTPERPGFRRFGHSKDRRPDRPQVVIGLAVTREGIPIRAWSFPGNASDQVLIRTVKADLLAWRLSRVVWVLDRGFASEENRRYLQRAGGHYILGEKLRAGRENAEALARPGRYASVREGLEVKEVWVGEGLGRRRFIVCRNPKEAARDAEQRKSALSRIAAELAAIARKRTAEDRRDAEALLLAHPTLGRYLRRAEGGLEVDRAAVSAEERLDGKFLLSCSDDTLSAEEVALGYKSLLEVERGWRAFKHTLDLRPVYHRKEERIRAHVLLCWLALLLIRVAEREVERSWPDIADEMARLHLGSFSGPAGTVSQRTELTVRQKDILRAVGAKEPPRFLGIAPAEAVPA